MTRTCTYRGCGKSMDHLSALAKNCEDCAQALRKDRKRSLRAAHTASKLSVSEPRSCQYPGCTTDISDKPHNTVWCSPCRLKMEKSREARRYGKEGRKAIDPFQRKVVHVCSSTHDRVPVVIKCKECCDMPWARAPDRYNTMSGSHDGKRSVVANGLCKGCGLPWEPEPAIERGPGIRSSAGMAQDHGRMYGADHIGSRATGRRH